MSFPRHHARAAALGLAVAVSGAIASPVFAVTPATSTITAPTDFVSSLSDTRATGHLQVVGSALRVFTQGATSTDKVAEYVATNTPLADAGEPSLALTNNGVGTTPPGFQLVVDFDGNGNNDGILVGEPTFYGNDWWLSNSAKLFVKNHAPSHTGGSGSANHGALDDWRTAFPNAKVKAFGFSLGSGVLGDWTIDSMDFAGTSYTFQSAPASLNIPADFVPALSDTRATGHKELVDSGLHIWTEGTQPTDKVAEYFATDDALTGTWEPSLALTNNGVGTIPPGFQLVVDFDGDDVPDGILVGETVYNGDWWASNGSQQFVKDGAPSHAGGFGSDYHGTLAQWRAAFPDARVKAFGFSLGSGVLGDWTINAMDYGGKSYTFAAPVVDTTAPTVSYALTPAAPGPGGWYNRSVTLTWTVNEDESPASLVKTGCVDQTISARQKLTSYTCNATSDGGTSPTTTVKIGYTDSFLGFTAPSRTKALGAGTIVPVKFALGDHTGTTKVTDAIVKVTLTKATNTTVIRSIACTYTAGSGGYVCKLKMPTSAGQYRIRALEKVGMNGTKPVFARLVNADGVGGTRTANGALFSVQ